MTRKTLLKRIRKQRKQEALDPGSILMFKEGTAAVIGCWRPHCTGEKPHRYTLEDLP